ncbi:hypothetical protein [Cellulomonas sp. A375-1]|uniref:hypothetical protein n=1 Tax=Cellulomonas sp. A375-1 TaxID=1672219 RepID=UPI0012E13090|nr:hypothetical protein [Cellulomonas sp. A375-1]
MAEQITTSEELDALPVESVVRGELGQTYARYDAGWFGVGRKHPLDVSTEVAYPLALIYRPDAPAPSDEDREAPSILAAADRFVGGDPVDDMAILLMRAWGEADPRSSVSRHPASHVATFVDMARAVLAARTPRPAPTVSAEQDGIDRACAWSDYRSEYGVSKGLVQAHKHFCAGWDAALGRLDIGGVQR